MVVHTSGFSRLGSCSGSGSVRGSGVPGSVRLKADTAANAGSHQYVVSGFSRTNEPEREHEPGTENREA